MNPKECHYFESCDAPICPMDEKTIKTSIWYPEEAICKNQSVNRVIWVKNQGKISRRAKDKTNTYYTLEMLNRKFKIGSALQGVFSGNNEDGQIKRWLESHKVLNRTEKQREALKTTLLTHGWKKTTPFRRGLEGISEETGTLVSKTQVTHSLPLVAPIKRR